MHSGLVNRQQAELCGTMPDVLPFNSEWPLLKKLSLLLLPQALSWQVLGQSSTAGLQSYSTVQAKVQQLQLYDLEGHIHKANYANVALYAHISYVHIDINIQLGGSKTNLHSQLIDSVLGAPGQSNLLLTRCCYNWCILQILVAGCCQDLDHV